MPDPEGFKAGSAWMDVKPNIDETEWHAKIAAALEGAGVAGGPQITSGLSKSIEDARPVLARDASQLGRSVADGIARGVTDGEAPIMDEAERIGKGIGVTIGDSAATDAAGRLRDSRGRFISAGEDIGAGIGDGLSRGVKPGLDDLDAELTERSKKSGQDAGKAAGDGMSPLIVSAFAGAATVGGPLLLAGVGTAVAGATALVLKGNQVIAADFQKVGKDAGDMVQAAAAPMTGELHAALTQMDAQVTGLKPEFKSLFADAEPDISQVTSGLTGFAGSVLPGVAQATKDSQVIVKDFSASLPVLGSDVGGFFTGLVRDANVQGQALNQTVGALGNTVRTAGSLIGSVSSAASADLLALTPVINGLDDAVQKISTPATVGGVAGFFGAMKFDSNIQSGLLSGAEGLSKVADRAEEAGGFVGKISGAASGASGVLSKMAGVVGGPWGLAIGAGIGLASGLAAALMNADDATKAITVDQATLADAVAKDGAKAGEATTGYIAAQAQLSGLADEAKSAGVPLDLLTQAAIGNTQAMGEVTVATGHANEAQRQSQLAGSELLTGQDALNTSMATGVNRLNESLVATNTLTTNNQQLINSVKAQAQQTADAINKQTQLNAATIELNNSTNIFNATLGADYQALTAKAQATGQSAVAALNLGTNQNALNMSLANAVSQYDMAKSAASGYGTVLQALAGSYGSMQAAEAQVDSNLQSLLSNQQQLGHSFTVGKGSGDQNIQMMNSYSQSILSAAQAIAQQDTQAGKSSQVNQDLTKYINQQRDAFVQQESKILGSKDAAQQLFDKYIDIKNIGTINTQVNANTGPAENQLERFLAKVDASTGTVQVYATTGNPSGGKALGANAGGGPVTAGSLSTVGEHGIETVLWGQDAYVLTHGQTVAMQSQSSRGGRGGSPLATQTVMSPTFIYNGPQAPSPEQQAQMMRDLASVLT